LRLLFGLEILTAINVEITVRLEVLIAENVEITLRFIGSQNRNPQVPAICPCPEPTPSSPHDPLQLPEDPS
jgi:hypothetical protein